MKLERAGSRRSAVAARMRERLRPPRRLRLRRSGVLLIAAVLSLGLATLNTGNNLLYLLVGAMLGLITLSGWLSEQSLSGIRVWRQLPFGATAGQPLRIEYRVENRKRRLPSGGLELRDLQLFRGDLRVRPDIHEPAALGLIPAGDSAAAAEVLTLPRRGVYQFDRLVLATSYPFGLFTKERDLRYPGVLVVWPRSDRPVPRIPVAGRDAGWRTAAAGARGVSTRGEYRGLRAYRPGDDPRDVHWRSTARRAEPIIREYDRDPGESWWLVLDLQAPSEAAGEAAIELAASVAANAAARGVRFGFAAGASLLPPSRAGGARLEAVLDLLARVELRPGEPVLPAPAAECVLVTARPGAAPGFTAVVCAPPAGAG